MSNWALILGASTGHGGATAISLAEKGYGILGFHFDRGDTKKEAERTISKVSELNGGMCHYWNTNAASEDNMDKYIPEIKEIVGDNPLRLLLHSIAFGTTTNFFGDKPVTQRQMDMTVHVMGNSLLYWTQKLFDGIFWAVAWTVFFVQMVPVYFKWFCFSNVQPLFEVQFGSGIVEPNQRN